MSASGTISELRLQPDFPHKEAFWWAGGGLGLLLILLAGIFLRAPHIQKDLLNRAQAVLQQDNLAALELIADGRDLHITGQVAAHSDIQSAMSTLKDLRGIRGVSHSVSVVEAQPKAVDTDAVPEAIKTPTVAPRLSIRRTGDELKVLGDLHLSQSLSATFIDLANSLKIENQIQQSDSIKTAVWLESLIPLLTALPLIQKAKLDIEDNQLTLSGQVDSKNILSGIQARIDSIDPALLKIESELKIVSNGRQSEAFLALEEPDLSLEQIGEQLRLSGSLPDQSTVDRILSVLHMHYKPDDIENQLKVSTGIRNASWLPESLNLLSGFHQLESAQISIEHGLLRLSGFAESAEIAENQARAVRSIAQFLEVENEIQILVAKPESPRLKLQSDLEKIDLSRILFASSRARINQQSLEELKRLATLLIQYPGIPIVVEGHTDATGDEKLNQALSQERAMAVSDFLIANGVDPSRVSAIGYGESRPLASNSSAEGRARNRRIEISF